MQDTQKIVLKYDTINNTYLINDEEVDKDTWILVKSTWEAEQSYNHIKKYINEWGFTSHDYYTKDNIDIWVFTTI